MGSEKMDGLGNNLEGNPDFELLSRRVSSVEDDLFRTLFEYASFPAIITSTDGLVMLANKRAYKLFSVPEGLDLRKINANQFYYHPGDRQKILQKLQQHGGFTDLEMMMKTLDGKPFWCLFSASLVNIQGQTVNFASFQDITKIKMVEDEFIKANKLDSIATLAGGIAHDFNNFLAAILANVSLARVYAKKEIHLVQERLDGIEKAVMRAKDLTQQLFIFAKGVEPVKKVVNMKELVVDSTMLALSGSNIFPKFIFSDEKLLAEVDEGQISQVVNNIVINAKQAMPDGGLITITVARIVIDDQHYCHPILVENGHYILLSFEDEGPGIAKEHLSILFDPFFTTKPSGSGLGLTTSYTIMKKHNGHITASNLPGRGARFEIIIPALLELTQHPQIKEMLQPGRGKVLFMDDDMDILNSTSRMLTYLGYAVCYASNGTDAYNIYKEALHTEHPFDVVILDLTIPGGPGGRETMERLLKLDPGVKAVISSGYSDDLVMSEYKDHGFKDIIVKPFTLEKMSEVVHRVINMLD